MEEEIMTFLYGLNTLRSGMLLSIIGLILCLTACGPKPIPYSQSVDAPEPSEVAVAHYNWGMAYAERGNFGQAITELTLAIQNEPGWVMPFFTLGVIYGNQGELDMAIQAWERATQLDADFAKAHYNLAVAYSHKEEKILSIASLREAIRVDDAALAASKTEPAFDLIRNTPEFQELEHSAEEKQTQE
jgi:tetratricopeptide (TPR) repeat protein